MVTKQRHGGGDEAEGNRRLLCSVSNLLGLFLGEWNDGNVTYRTMEGEVACLKFGKDGKNEDQSWRGSNYFRCSRKRRRFCVGDVTRLVHSQVGSVNTAHVP